MRWSVGLLGIAACGFRIGDGVPGSDATTDPDALVSDGGLDAPIDAPPGPGDLDGDGILDVADNCPTTGNPDQHDEDADLRGDACDPCPYIASAALEVDTDGDMIGDACDPHPSTPGDVLVRFEPFAQDGGLPAGWSQLGTTTWTVSNDALRGAAGTTTEVLTFPAASSVHTIEIGLRVMAAPGGGQNFVSAMTNVAANADQYFACGYRFDSPASRELFYYDTAAAPQFTSLGGSMAMPPSVPDDFRLRLTSDPGNVICALTGGSYASSAVAPGNTSVGLRMRNVNLVIRFVAIYRR